MGWIPSIHSENPTPPAKRMNPWIKEAWVNALRDGGYPEGVFHLNDGQGFCVLGVLCELYAGEHSNARWKEHEDGLTYFHIGEDTFAEEAVPREVVKWAGLPDAAGTIHPMFIPEISEILDQEGSFWKRSQLETWSEDGKFNLADINDKGFSFKVLARIIEVAF